MIRPKRALKWSKLLKVNVVRLLEGLGFKFPYFTGYIISSKWLKSSRVSISDGFTTLWHGLKRILHAGSTNDFRRNHPIFVSRRRKLNPPRAQTILIELRRWRATKTARSQIALAVRRRISWRSGGAAGDQWGVTTRMVGGFRGTTK